MRGSAWRRRREAQQEARRRAAIEELFTLRLVEPPPAAPPDEAPDPRDEHDSPVDADVEVLPYYRSQGGTR